MSLDRIKHPFGNQLAVAASVPGAPEQAWAAMFTNGSIPASAISEVANPLHIVMLRLGFATERERVRRLGNTTALPQRSTLSTVQH